VRFFKQVDAQTPAELQLHLIVDNYSTHKNPEVKAWLARHRRFHLHFTPTSASWLNMVERFFRDLTQQAIVNGSFQSVKDLVEAIDAYLADHNLRAQTLRVTSQRGRSTSEDQQGLGSSNRLIRYVISRTAQ
jgi:hypothetical protein